MSGDLGQVVYIVVGTPNENPTRLTCFDWYPSIDFPGRADCSTAMPETVQAVIDWLKRGSPSEVLNDMLMGSWNVEVKKKGKYRVTARILPSEAEDDVLLKPGEGFMKFGEKQFAQAIDPKRSSVTFEVEFADGKGRLECWFSGQLPNDHMLGAFYADVELIE